MKITRFTLLFILLATSICWTGCEMFASHTDPLVGWKPSDGNHLDKVIIDDYKDFIAKNNLAPEYATLGFFENGAGQHAVEFTAYPPNQNASWHYLLIYNNDNRRIKVKKYSYVRYQS
jgi:hypothetical protein